MLTEQLLVANLPATYAATAATTAFASKDLLLRCPLRQYRAPYHRGQLYFYFTGSMTDLASKAFAADVATAAHLRSPRRQM